MSDRIPRSVSAAAAPGDRRRAVVQPKLHSQMSLDQLTSALAAQTPASSSTLQAQQPPSQRQQRPVTRQPIATGAASFLAPTSGRPSAHTATTPASSQQQRSFYSTASCPPATSTSYSAPRPAAMTVPTRTVAAASSSSSVIGSGSEQPPPPVFRRSTTFAAAGSSSRPDAPRQLPVSASSAALGPRQSGFSHGVSEGDVRRRSASAAPVQTGHLPRYQTTGHVNMQALARQAREAADSSSSSSDAPSPGEKKGMDAIRVFKLTTTTVRLVLLSGRHMMESLQQQHRQYRPLSDAERGSLVKEASTASTTTMKLIAMLREQSKANRNSLVLLQSCKDIGKSFALLVKALSLVLFKATSGPTVEQVQKVETIWKRVTVALKNTAPAAKKYLLIEERHAKRLDGLQDQTELLSSLLGLARETTNAVKNLDSVLYQEVVDPMAFAEGARDVQRAIDQLVELAGDIEATDEADQVREAHETYIAVAKLYFRTHTDWSQKVYKQRRGEVAQSIATLIRAASGLNKMGKSAADAPVGGAEPAATPGSEEEEKQKRNRKHAVSEIFTTEETYLRSLKIVIESFSRRLSLETNMITSADLELLFSNVDVLFATNLKFFQALLARLSEYKNDYSACKIGDIFVEYADSFLVYTDYVNKFDSALEVLQRNQANPKFSKFLQKIMAEGKIPLDLGAYLINPVQRLPRYELLLREVVKHTPEGHIDYQSVNEAQATLKEVNERINQNKRDQEMRTKVRQLHSMMWSDMCVVPDLVKRPDCMLVRDAVLDVAIHFVRKDKTRDKERAKPYQVYMFDELMVFAREKKEREKNIYLRSVIRIVASKVQPIDLDQKEGCIAALQLTSEDDSRPGFQIVHTLQFANPRERALWVASLHTCKESAALSID